MVSRARLAVAATLALAHGTAAQLLNLQHASITTTEMSSSKAGYSTYRVGVNFDSGTVEDVYALFGEDGDVMMIPPAFQVAAPFGADVGPVRRSLARSLARLAESSQDSYARTQPCSVTPCHTVLILFCRPTQRSFL